MDLPPKLCIAIEENTDITHKERRFREWCGSLVGAMAWVSNLISHESYVFRGHADTAYVLDSSLKRLKKPTTLNQLKVEENALLASVAHDFWFTRMFGFTPASSSEDQSYERTIAALQHHGIPTRLLDFTADPLVALYFATIGERQIDDKDEQDGEVILIRNFKLSEGLPLHVIPAPQISERVTAQRGRFSVHTDEGSVPASGKTVAFDFANIRAANGSGTDFDILVDKYLTGDFQGRPAVKAPNIMKFVIPSKLKPTCRAILRNMGISARTLFPGHEGFRRDLVDF